MKSTTNVFLEGLITDLHPLSTSQKCLTDALNATMLTYNGNEMMLQNDMGNTLILDSTTGHIMGLSEGFVPVGLKEHGGVMYIISANKEGVSEIGTIPSSILTLSLKANTMSGDSIPIVENSGPVAGVTALTDFKVYPGEKFLAILDLNYRFESFFKVYGIPQDNIYDNRFLFSTIDINTELCKHDGLYLLKLYSMYDSTLTELSHVLNKISQPFFTNGTLLTENVFWFIPPKITPDIGMTELNSIDLELTYLNKGFHTYPGNLPPGQLAIKACLENIDGFDLIQINLHVSSKLNITKAPYIKTQASNDGPTVYNLLFPGFTFQTQSCRMVGKVEVTLLNLKDESYINLKHTELSIVDQRLTLEANKGYIIYFDNDNNYQIINSSSEGPIIAGVEKVENETFIPLFEASIGSLLDCWYLLTVTYYDLFGGAIDTYTFSFNPYHTVYFSESYYNITYKPDSFVNQYFNIEGDLEVNVAKERATRSYDIKEIAFEITKEGLERVSFSDSTNYYTTGPLGTTINIKSGRISYPGADADTNTYIFQNKGPIMNYLYNLKKLDKDIIWLLKSTYTSDYKDGVTGHSSTGLKSDYIYSSVVVHGNVGVDAGFWPVIATDSLKYQCYMRLDGATYVDGKETHVFGTGPSINTIYDRYNNSITLAASQEHAIGASYCFKTKMYEDLNKTTKFRIPSILSLSIMNIASDRDIDTGIKLHYNIPSGCSFSFKSNYEFPNKSHFQLTPHFSIYGDTDEKNEILLGYDRNGDLCESLRFEDSLYAQDMPPKTTIDDRLSSFKKDILYHTTTGCGGQRLLSSGVYLIVPDVGPGGVHQDKNTLTDYYNSDYTEGYWCNTDWNDADGNPKIAIKVGNLFHQIARIDTWDVNNQHRIRTFLPTLIYIPKDSIIELHWKNVNQLLDLLLYEVTQDIVYEDGKGFNEGTDIKVSYYLNPDFKKSRDIILPCIYTYFELAECHGNTYMYYPGTGSKFAAVNRHVDVSGKYVCWGKDKNNTSNSDYTYIWDPGEGLDKGSGYGLYSYIYLYSDDLPTEAKVGQFRNPTTIITYRKENDDIS